MIFRKLPELEATRAKVEGVLRATLVAVAVAGWLRVMVLLTVSSAAMVVLAGMPVPVIRWPTARSRKLETLATVVVELRSPVKEAPATLARGLTSRSA